MPLLLVLPTLSQMHECMVVVQLRTHWEQGLGRLSDRAASWLVVSHDGQAAADGYEMSRQAWTQWLLGQKTTERVAADCPMLMLTPRCCCCCCC